MSDVQSAAPATAQPTRWVTAEVLGVLANMGALVSFSGERLANLTSKSLTREQRNQALTRLVALGFLTLSVVTQGGSRHDIYSVTPEGAAAIKAAAAGHVRKSGPKGRRAPNPVRPDDVATKLWALMRMRKVLDSDAAARTLCNAGEQDFERLRATVRKTLRRWELAGALQAGAKRVATPGQAKSSNGSKRYVLVVDSGPTPPRWRAATRATLGSQAVPAVNEGGAA